MLLNLTMKIYYIIIVFVIISIISYLKISLIYNPLKASEDKYNKFYQKIFKLAESDAHVVNTFVKTIDNIQLDTLYLKNSDSDICVIFFHGNAGNLAMRFDMIKFIYNFASVLIFDYRTYGKSGGSLLFISDDKLQLDANTIWEYATTNLKYPPNKISLFGESIGSSIALALGAKLSKTLNPSLYPHSVVLNAPFYSLKSMVRIVFDKLRIGFVGHVIENLFGTEYKSDIQIQYINHITKIIIAHSPRDEIVPYKESQKLFQLISSTHPKVKFVNISGTHNNLYLTDPYIYALSDLYQF